jgi:hypothetical protein
MRNFIYGLVDPRTTFIHYIGKSSIGMDRPREHMRASELRHDTTRKSVWIRQLLADGITYEIKVLEYVADKERLNEAERRWIAHGRQANWPLTNLTDGGDGASSPRPPETLAKIRAARALQPPHSEESRAKMSAARKGKPPGNAGKKATLVARANMSAAHTGRVFSEEHRANIAASKLGKPRPDVVTRMQTPEARAQLAELHEMGRGRPRPDLTALNRADWKRAQVSAKLKGRKFSEETLAKMRAAQQRRRARARGESIG